MPTSGVMRPVSERPTPRTAASAARNEVSATVRPMARGIPERRARSEVTTMRATSMPMPRSLVGPEAARGSAAKSESAAQPR